MNLALSTTLISFKGSITLSEEGERFNSPFQFPA